MLNVQDASLKLSFIIIAFCTLFLVSQKICRPPSSLVCTMSHAVTFAVNALVASQWKHRARSFLLIHFLMILIHSHTPWEKLPRNSFKWIEQLLFATTVKRCYWKLCVAKILKHSFLLLMPKTKHLGLAFDGSIIRQGCQFGFFESRFSIFGFFWTPLFFLEIKKTQTKSVFFLAFFQSEGLGSGKTLSELHIHYKFILKRVCNRAGCTKYWKDFTVALKMIEFIDKKQIYDSVISGKVNVSKEWNCIVSMLLTSVNVCFVFGYAYFMCWCLKTAVWLFWVTAGWQPCYQKQWKVCSVTWHPAVLLHLTATAVWHDSEWKKWPEGTFHLLLLEI